MTNILNRNSLCKKDKNERILHYKPNKLQSFLIGCFIDQSQHRSIYLEMRKQSEQRFSKIPMTNVQNKKITQTEPIEETKVPEINEHVKRREFIPVNQHPRPLPPP